ncbi:MAG: hypothetical protein HDR71_03975 [Lachnospiraceae bacterium]|nr:hypothetical protein [Lachnospiraceae bacterium]
MNTVLKIVLSMSVSGALLILVLFIGKRFLKDRISRQWQYYIWLIVILRMLLPFGPEINLMGKIYQAMGQTITAAVFLPSQQISVDIPDEFPISSDGLEQNNEKMNELAESFAVEPSFQDIVTVLIKHIWMIWLAVAAAMLIRKITIYQSFIQYINCGSTPVSDIKILDQLSAMTDLEGVKRPVELLINPLVSSPLLIGFFHPCIVLPGVDNSEKEFRYIILHELTHYRRGDMFYKWLIQITVCLHWFNPFVYLMCKEIAKACEFSCDEAVLIKTGYQNAREYGKILLDAMVSVGKYKESLGALTLNENKQLLKERLEAIMNLKEKTKVTKILTGVLTVCIILGALFIGVYPVNAVSYREESVESNEIAISEPDEQERFTQTRKGLRFGISSPDAEQCYEAGSLPLFQIAFSRLDEDEQRTWMEKIYADGEIAFFSISVDELNIDSPLIRDFAEKFYEDGSVSFFSVLTNRMTKETMESWLDRALEDRKSSFQSVLFDKLEKDGEKNALEKELEQKQMEEYETAGVIKNGKDYYFQGQLVNIFLDARPGKPYYTLNLNPKGTVNVKIDRGEDGEITGAVYMTEEEVAELFITQ